MPTSWWLNIPKVITELSVYNTKNKIRTLLDVGTGWGKYGMLCRDFIDCWGTSKSLTDRASWELDIIGIEGDRSYKTALHDLYYTRMYWGDIKTVLAAMPADSVDAAIMVDVIEHFEKDAGFAVLQNLMRVAKFCVVATPSAFMPQEWPDHPFETHRSVWSIQDFETLGFTAQISDLTVIARAEK